MENCTKVTRKNILTIVWKSSIGKSSIRKSSIAIRIGWVGCSISISKSWLSRPLLAVSSSFCGSSNGSSMSSLSLSNLSSVLWSNGEFRVEGWGNTIIDRGNWKTRIGNTETGSISNVLNLLEGSVGINIRVSSADSSVGVSNFLFSRVDVSIAIVKVAKLILSMELASGCVRGSSNDGSSSYSRSSSIGHSRSLNSLNLDLGWGSNCIRKTGIAISISSVWKPCIGQRGGKKFGFLSEANGQESGQDCNGLHDVHCCVMLNGVTPCTL